MPRFLIKSNHKITYTADVDVELPENRDDLAGFMEKYEEENEVNWTQVDVVTYYSGDEV
jgi:hypothetical protein